MLPADLQPIQRHLDGHRRRRGHRWARMREDAVAGSAPWPGAGDVVRMDLEAVLRVRCQAGDDRVCLRGVERVHHGFRNSAASLRAAAELEHGMDLHGELRRPPELDARVAGVCPTDLHLARPHRHGLRRRHAARHGGECLEGGRRLAPRPQAGSIGTPHPGNVAGSRPQRPGDDGAPGGPVAPDRRAELVVRVAGVVQLPHGHLKPQDVGAHVVMRLCPSEAGRVRPAHLGCQRGRRRRRRSHDGDQQGLTEDARGVYAVVGREDAEVPLVEKDTLLAAVGQWLGHMEHR
mmetsp:Transcript_30344/g.87525  ORF Transcript_30344/g.87525 Transcript_30344/m.87525 type:complete len:291 (-) Transcript_30344:1510-2382(-)